MFKLIIVAITLVFTANAGPMVDIHGRDCLIIYHKKDKNGKEKAPPETLHVKARYVSRDQGCWSVWTMDGKDYWIFRPNEVVVLPKPKKKGK